MCVCWAAVTAEKEKVPHRHFRSVRNVYVGFRLGPLATTGFESLHPCTHSAKTQHCALSKWIFVLFCASGAVYPLRAFIKCIHDLRKQILPSQWPSSPEGPWRLHSRFGEGCSRDSSAAPRLGLPLSLLLRRRLQVSFLFMIYDICARVKWSYKTKCNVFWRRWRRRCRVALEGPSSPLFP